MVKTVASRIERVIPLMRGHGRCGRGLLLAVCALWLSACANVSTTRLSHESEPPEMSLPPPKNAPLVQWVAQAQAARVHQKTVSLESSQKNSDSRLEMKSTARITQKLKKPLVHEALHQALEQAADTADESAVYPLSNGVEAFAARSELVRNAQSSLDLQYYTLQNGLSTRLLLREVVAAAERGVRVRVLLDDREQLGRDKDMLILNAHPNIEVRVFNPIKRFRANLVTRWMVFVSNLSTLRRRMHNKMWLADGVLGITGGRNLSDKYFNAGEADNFSDMDVLIAGRAVNDMQSGFDQYWNSAQVMRVDDFDAQHQAWRRTQITQMLLKTSRLTRHERVQRHPYLQAIRQTEDTLLDDVVAKMRWGRVHFMIDPPDKIATPADPMMISLPKAGEIRPHLPVFDGLMAALNGAQKEVLVVSPYFLPGDELTDYLIDLHQRDIHVTVLTNSLESNDVPVVNGHYDHYRDRLLAAGVAVYELRGYPDVPAKPEWRHPIFSFRGSRTALHSKVVIIDGKVSFVGSMNLDHCSVTGNTEGGVLIEQTEFSQQLRDLFINQLQSRYSYALKRDDTGRVYWYLDAPKADDDASDLDARGGQIITREPGNFWRRLQKWVGSWLPESYM